MTGKQNAVMWMGLLLVAANLFYSPMWKALWNGTILKGEPKSKSGTGTQPPNGLGNPGGGGPWWMPYMNTTGSGTTTPPSPTAAQLSV